MKTSNAGPFSRYQSEKASPVPATSISAKEKAQELFDKMCQTITSDCPHDSYCTEKECKWKGMVYCKAAQNEAKQCAIICVDEILNQPRLYFHSLGEDEYFEYWQQVRSAIQSL